ncbi:hypothetical protein QC823_15885 [Halomonas vilamensis]|uniref:Uncharacterized protein n=1 Tax=Vreelandella vilamensis TaxID=531309 RepID=A0ABU1H891_9GAMM|nr:hypothetical protein [Halomonas vilamensis]MDR5900444.1 hypothetical protein [Halomonas vilamensis]
MSKYDWESIHSDYRTGQLSVRAIAAKHGTHEATIRRRAKVEGWQRDLTQHVRTATVSKLLRSETTHSTANLPDDDHALVEAAADTNVRLVLEHREQIARWKGIASKLAITLADMDVTEDNVADFARTLNSGVDALGKCIRLERQAFSMDSKEQDHEPPERRLTDDELEARIIPLCQPCCPVGDIA